MTKTKPSITPQQPQQDGVWCVNISSAVVNNLSVKKKTANMIFINIMKEVMTCIGLF